MKARHRKHMIAKHFAVKNVTPTATPTIEVKPTRAFDLLFKELTPIQELLEDDLEVLDKKPRGRPRKYFPESEMREDHHTHKMEDVVTIKPIGPNQKLKMVEMFRFHYRVNGLPLNAALERIEQAYKISHRQAHQLLESEF